MEQDTRGETERVPVCCHASTGFQLAFAFKFSHRAHCSCVESNRELEASVSQLEESLTQNFKPAGDACYVTTGRASGQVLTFFVSL